MAEPAVTPGATRGSGRRLVHGALVVAGVLAALLAASLALFLERPNHRVGGIAWNALFQVFGPFLGLLYAFTLVLLCLLLRRCRAWGVGIGLLLALVSGYCWWRAWPILMSV